MPSRIQLQRTKGWRKPAGVVTVSRPSFYGNPFPVDVYGQDGAVDLFERWLTGKISMSELSQCSTTIEGSLVTARHILLKHLPLLRGKSVACWCRLEARCHGDVLLRLANDGQVQ